MKNHQLILMNFLFIKSFFMKFSIDSTDLAILAIVQDDASLSNQALAERVGVSPATCLRRVQRLRDAGVLEKEVAIVNPWALAKATGRPPAITCIVEVSLDRQDSAAQQAFETAALQHPQVQQCWRVAAGPDFVLIINCLDMPAWHTFSQALFTRENNVRNIKAYFATHRARWNSSIPLPHLKRP